MGARTASISCRVGGFMTQLLLFRQRFARSSRPHLRAIAMPAVLDEHTTSPTGTRASPILLFHIAPDLAHPPPPTRARWTAPDPILGGFAAPET